MQQDAKALALMERRFFGAMGLGLLLIALIGFARTWFLAPLFPDIPKPGEAFYYWLHGPVITLWMVLIAVQPWLIGRGNYRLHQRLGWFGLAVAVLVLVTGLWGGLLRAGGHADMIQTGMPPKKGWATPFMSMMTFAILVAIGFWKRKDRATHKRAMILATIGMMGAPLARWPVIGDWSPGWMRLMVELIIVALAIYDWRTTGRLYKVTLWGGLLLVVAHRVIKPLIWETQGWLNFTDALLRLVGLA